MHRTRVPSVYPVLTRSLSPSARAARRDEGGFAITELVVAMAVFAVVAAFMSQMLAGGLKGVLLGKRREIASQEANKVLETARSLAYDAVGLVQNDPTIPTDTAITEQSGKKSYLSDGTWEPIMFATNATDHPFNPHVAEITRASTDLVRYVYVTGVDSDGNGSYDLKRVAVRVTWNEDTTNSGARNEVRAQTLIHNSPPPQNHTATTPLFASTRASGPRVSIKSARGDIVGLLDAVLPSTPVTLNLPTTSGESEYRVVSTVNCTSKSTELSGLLNYGGHSVTVTADDDATTNTPTNPGAQQYTGSPPDSITGLDDVGDVLAETTIASPVDCMATAADADGNPPADDGLAYEKGTGASFGSVNLVEDLTGTGLASSVLNAVALETTPVNQEIDHQTVAGQREVYAAANASFGLANILKIPGVFADGLVRLDAVSYGASVRAADGTPSAAPAVTSPTVNLRIYDAGNEVTGCTSRSGSYCVLAIDPAAAGFTGRTIEFEHNVLQNLGLLNLKYEIRVDVLPPAKDPVNGVSGTNGELRWSAEYTPLSVSARLKAELTVNALLNLKVLLTDTQVDLNLGTVKAEACAGATC